MKYVLNECSEKKDGAKDSPKTPRPIIKQEPQQKE